MKENEPSQEAQPMSYEDAQKRFWSKVDASSPTGCWWWEGGLNEDGYGVFSTNVQKWLAHRFSYHINIGPLPLGTVVRHRCDNPTCVRPDHLQPGTHQQNVDDAVSKGRHRNYIHKLENTCRIYREELAAIRRRRYRAIQNWRNHAEETH